MSQHFQRAIMLIQQSREELAEKELRKGLAEDPDDAFGHALLALCLADREVYDEATSAAQHSIYLQPDLPFSHYALAMVLLQRNREKEAEQAIHEAIRLDPDDERYFGCLANILFKQRRWQEALDAADRGLMIDAGNDFCANLRTMALVKLGRLDDANRTMDQALERNPDDAYTHANLGWTLLEQGDSAQSLEHFREALRIDPSLDWARLGITSALKARYFVYRIILAFFFKMSKLSRGAQWGIIIGGYVTQRVLRSIAAQNPDFAPFVWPVLIAYIAFVVLTWIADPLFNLLLRLNRYGRLALSREQVITSNWVGILLSVSLCSLAAYFVFQSILALLLAVLCGLTIPPLSRIYSCDVGWPRTAMISFTAGVFAVGAVATVALTVGLAIDSPLGSVLFSLGLALLVAFGIGAVGSQFAANYLADAVVRR